jgi:deoxyribodipyrimidine photo-lyase
MAANVMWFRRDLRLADNPALLAAAGQRGFGDGAAAVLPLFVLDPTLWRPAGTPRRDRLAASLQALHARLGDVGLHVRHGDPVRQVVVAARQVGAAAVHVAADYGPYGSARDNAVAAALAEHDIAFVRTGSAYAVDPGRVRTKAGEPFQIFTPYSRQWRDHGWNDPAPAPKQVRWLSLDGGVALPRADLRPAGETAARRRWARFRDNGLDDYRECRDRPDNDGTSGLSAALKFGELHPRTLLADLAERGSAPGSENGSGADAFRTELAWREFWADVLHHRPATAREYLRPEFARMRYDPPGEPLRAWQAGLTGFPLVDAGMRQLAHTGWMHNRVRMVVASFLVKDLHIEWQHGARHFMRMLRDGDLASNSLNWQWAAGCGTDAAPYFRVFNPVLQGSKFDPDGAYARRWVPELRHLAGAAVHTPWDQPAGYRHGYPQRIVDHDAERLEALRRFREIPST